MEKKNLKVTNLFSRYSGMILAWSFITVFSAACGEDEEPAEVALENIEISVNNAYPAVGEEIIAEAKNIPSGATLEWNWNDNSPKATETTVTHSYEAEGKYSLQLTVSVGAQSKTYSMNLEVEGIGLTRALQNFDDSKIWIMAHRGNTGRTDVPENSLAALAQCIASKSVDVMEIDPRITKDGVIINMHDDNIDRTTNGTGKVADLTYDQIQQYNLVLPDGTVTDQKVPTVKDLFLAGRGKIYFNLDSKVDATALYKVVEECGMLDRVLFYSGTDITLSQRLLAISKNLHVYPFYSKESVVTHLADYNRPFFTQINCSHANNGTGAAIVGKGLLVSVNHLDSTDPNVDTQLAGGNYTSVENLLAKGNVHMIQTDNCTILHNYLLQKGKR